MMNIDFESVIEVETLNEALSTLVNAIVLMTENFKPLKALADELTIEGENHQQQFEFMVNRLQALNFHAATILDLTAHSYSLCSMQEQDIKIDTTQEVLFIAQISVPATYLNPLIKPTVKQTLEQCCNSTTELVSIIDAFRNGHIEGEFDTTKLTVIEHTLTNLYLAFFICFNVLQGQSAAQSTKQNIKLHQSTIATANA